MPGTPGNNSPLPDTLLCRAALAPLSRLLSRLSHHSGQIGVQARKQGYLNNN
jgi:hypothetical protein